MNSDINVSKFHIIIAGDESVGIPNIRYELGSDFIFENQEELNDFKDKIREAFEEFYDAPVSIISEEEFNKWEKEFEKTAKEAAEADMNFQEPPMTDEELDEEIKKDWSDD